MGCNKMMNLLVLMAFVGVSSATLFNLNDFTTWGGQRVQILDGGRAISLSLDNSSGSGFESNAKYLFGRFDMQLKLVPGNSAGTVATFFLSSQGPTHDEIDLEFLGNSSGQPYTLHTNIFTQGVGNREQQFRLWFNPTSAFHTYTILWNSGRIIIMVDNIPIRVFNNYAAKGVPFASTQPMGMYASLWNADDWATQGGRVKTDWTKAPFTVYYRNYNVNACVVSGSCAPGAWRAQGLNAAGRNRIRWVQQKYMIYNYCNDVKRFPQGLPKECKLPKF